MVRHLKGCMLFLPLWLNMMQQTQSHAQPPAAAPFAPSPTAQNPALKYKSSPNTSSTKRAVAPSSDASLSMEQALSKADGIAATVFTTDGKCVAHTPSFKQFFADKKNDVCGAFEGKGSAEWIEALQEAAETGVAQAVRIEALPDSSHAHHRWFDVEIQRQPSAAGKTMLLCLWRDVTGEIEAERGMLRSKLEAEMALQSRSEFLASMSHDLRTPLNAILGFAQMMDKQMLGRINNPTYREYIKCINNSGEELLNKINDLMELANLDVGSTEIHEEAVELNSLMKDILETHAHNAFDRNVTIQLEMPESSTWVKADRLKIMKAVNNLLGNALKFSPAGSTVHLCYKKLGPYLNIVVKDEGQGMPQKQYRHVQQLIQSDNVVDRARDTVGMGLAVAKEYARMHQGELRMKSKAGIGTTATFCLPTARIIPAPNHASYTKKKKSLEVA